MKASYRTLLLLFCLTCCVGAQTSKPPQTPPADKEKNTGDIGITVQDAPKSQKPVETRISPKEAEELFKSIDEILEFASNDTGLPIKSSVKREMATREQVTKYVEERLAEDEDQKRLERT